MMFIIWRSWNLSFLAAAFVYVDFILWRMALPWDNHVIIHLDTTPLLFFWVFRCVVTAHLILTFVYFHHHCVVAQREENTRIIIKG